LAPFVLDIFYWEIVFKFESNKKYIDPGRLQSYNQIVLKYTNLRGRVSS